MQIDETARRKLGRALVRIVDDYEQWQEPFSQAGGITTPITNEISGKRETALYLTLTSALNRQRDAEQLYTKFGRLYEEEPWIFDPETLIEEREFEELTALFEKEGTRFGRRDAEVWYEISRTLYEEYAADPMNLFEECDYNMQRLKNHVRSASGETRFFQHGKRFPALRGDKIRPMWLRLISRQVHPLKQSENAAISVDTHIINITNELLGREYSNTETDKAEIRTFWQNVCRGADVDPIEVDGPLWFISRDWTDWGREYLTRELEQEGLSLNELESTHTDSPTERNSDSRSSGLAAELERQAERLREEAAELEARAEKLRESRSNAKDQ